MNDYLERMEQFLTGYVLNRAGCVDSLHGPQSAEQAVGAWEKIQAALRAENEKQRAK